jgi:hypothetical protein
MVTRRDNVNMILTLKQNIVTVKNSSSEHMFENVFASEQFVYKNRY